MSESAREVYDLNWIYGRDHAGVATARDYITTGKNSGYQAISLAHLFGASRVILLGFDLQVGESGEAHWHGNHPKGLGNSGPGRYGTWAKAMTRLAADLEATPCKVLNASRRTALRCFRRVTLETALHEI